MAIKKDITVTVENKKSIMSDSVWIYQEDKNIDIYFTIIDTRFEFSTITPQKYNFTIRKPDGDLLPITEITPLIDNKVKFTITEQMAYEFDKVGMYDILIHLYDDLDSRISIPEITFEVKQPLMTTNALTNSGFIQSAILDGINEKLDRLDDNGNYIKTLWNKGDLITNENLNKIENQLSDTSLKLTENTQQISFVDTIKLQAIYSVKYDGTDESTKVQQMINETDNEIGGVIYIPAGKTLVADFTIGGKNFIVTGGGTLQGSITIKDLEEDVNSRPWNWIIDNIIFSKMPIKAEDYKHQNIPTDSNAINLQNTLRGKITNCSFYFYDKAINFMAYDRGWQVGRVLVSSCSFHGVKYALYGAKPQNATKKMTISDSQFINNHVEYAFVTGIHLEGIDGFQCVGNVFFSPVSTDNTNDNNKIKKHNIYIDGCDWVNIQCNTCFEAGEEAIKLGHFQHVSVNNNIIGLCGQLIPKDAIYMWGGNLDSAEYCISKITSNNIMRPTRSGIVIEVECGHITVCDNTIYECGASSYYIGTIDLGTIPHFGVYYNGNKAVTVLNNYSPINDVFVLETPVNTRFMNIDKTYSNTNNSYKRLTLSNNNTSSTIDASKIDVVVLNQAPSTTITSITGGIDGKKIELWAYSGNTTISASVGSLKGNADVKIPSNGFLTLKMINGVWREYHRSF